MNQKMLDLIDTVIGDGELEQEEIDYLKEKASEYGESPIEVVSLAKTMMKQQEAKRKETFEGEVKKCPHCGEIINGLSKTCASCGKMINVENLEQLMDSFVAGIEGARISEKKSQSEEFALAKVFYSSIIRQAGDRNDMQNWIKHAQEEIKAVSKMKPVKKMKPERSGCSTIFRRIVIFYIILFIILIPLCNFLLSKIDKIEQEELVEVLQLENNE